MSAQHGIVASIGFAIEFIRTWLSIGAELESLYNGMLGALGALIAKELYELVKKKIKQHKEDVQREGETE